MKVTDKKFLNVHHAIGPMTANGGYHNNNNGPKSAATPESAEDLAAKAADKLLVSVVAPLHDNS